MDLKEMGTTNPLNELSPGHRVAIITHVNPDGDAYGSVLGLMHLLDEAAIRADGFIEDDRQSKYSFLPGYDRLLRDAVSDGTTHYECCFVLDCASLDRISRFEDIIRSSDKVVNIDHHVSNTLFGDVQLVQPNRSSTAEMISDLAIAAFGRMEAKAATCLLTGMITDTGGFAYENVSASTFRMAAELLEFGADHPNIHLHLYQNRPMQNARLLSRMIESMELFAEETVAVLTVSIHELEKFEVAYEDLDECVEFVRDLKGIECAVLLKERSSVETKVSFRSKKWLDVNKVAGRLGGGGHKRAAGATLHVNMDKAKSEVIHAISLHTGDEIS